MTTPIHFAIDLEPDDRLPEAGAVSIDNAGVALSTMMRWRERLEHETGLPARFGWYVRMDAHIGALFGAADAIARRYQRELESVLESGDEVGLHIHSAEMDREGRWRVNYDDAGLISETVDQAFDEFSSFFGRPCRAARMGDMWTSLSCARHLATRGLRYDLSWESSLRAKHLKALYPGTTSKGRVPSMITSPLKPFLPFVGEPSAEHMWVLPLSSHRRRDYAHPGMWWSAANTTVATGFKRWRPRDVLRPQSDYSPKGLETAIQCALREPEQPGLCVAVRNFGAADRIERFFDILCGLAKRQKLQFCTPADYVRLSGAEA